MALSTGEAKFLWAERQQESGGNYKAINSSSGALGGYQIMPANLPSWEKQANLPQETGQAFLNDPTEQDQLAIAILGGYYNKYGDKGAAAMWYSGQKDPTKTYGNPPVYQYVADVVKLEGEAPDTGLPGGATVQSGSTSTAEDAAATGAQSSFLTSLLGIGDIQDVMERTGLILLGGVLLLIGIIKFGGLGEKAKVAAQKAAEVAVVA